MRGEERKMCIGLLLFQDPTLLICGFHNPRSGISRQGIKTKHTDNHNTKVLSSVFEFNEFEPRLKSAKNRFQLSADNNLETLNTILSWNQLYLSRGLNLSRGSNSLNSASDQLFKVYYS